MPGRPQVRDEGGADQTGRAGDEDAHAVILADRRARARPDPAPISAVAIRAELGLERALLRRALIVVRKRAASAPSTRRWS